MKRGEVRSLAIAEKNRALSAQDSLSRPLLGELAVNRESLAYLALAAFAALIRFWDLGSRALHHDESLHAIYSWYLYVGRGYQHDPMMHGPFQFHAVALIYLLFGASDFTARVVPALFGTWVVIAPYFLRREMGRTAAFIAAVLFAVSPTFLYFSRFIRNDMYMAGWAMLVLIGLFGYLRERKSRYLYMLIAGVAFSFATKETVYITGFVFLMAFLGEGVLSLVHGRRPLLWTVLRSLSRREWAVSVAIFLVVNVVLYTTFFTNPRGIVTGTTGALEYWLAQHDVQRGAQPWFYYAMLMPLYEFLPLLAAAAGGVYILVRRQVARQGFLVWLLFVWFGLGLLIYSWAGEKMPWLLVHTAQPLILLAALALGGLARRAGRAVLTGGTGLLALTLTGLLAATVLGGLVAAEPPRGTELGMQSATLQKGLMWLMVALFAGGLIVLGVRRGSGAVLVPAAVAASLVLMALTIRTAWGVTYARGDIPQDMLVYVQSSPDVPKVVKEIERISFQTGAGKDLRILMDGGYTDNAGGQSIVHESISWPFEWYLRDYKGRSYYSRTLPAPLDAPVILSMTANQDPIRGQLGNYLAVRGRLNWWYPEDYKTLTLEKVWEGLKDPAVRAKIWRYFMYREVLNPLGSRDFDLFVRSDLARGISLQSGGQVAAPAAPAPVAEAVAQTAPGGITVFGKTAGGGSVLVEPRDVAVAPDGLIYTLDSTGSRVVVFRPDGSVAQQWGRKGSADGEFNDPWGLALGPDGDVYVADTWNHRIQVFDRNGRFIRKWGSFVDAKGQVDAQPGNFWGPRDVAVTAAGDLLVTDAGNKRVQLFDPQGRFVSAFGGDGTDPGKMREPVGIAVDGSGNVYVADTWNRRVQKFDARYRPLAQFPAPGWDTQNVLNKPYLAVSQDGRIIFTEPEKHRLVVMSSNGQVEATRGSLGSEPNAFNTPVGVAVTPQGEILVADSRNARVVKYHSWR